MRSRLNIAQQDRVFSSFNTFGFTRLFFQFHEIEEIEMDLRRSGRCFSIFLKHINVERYHIVCSIFKQILVKRKRSRIMRSNLFFVTDLIAFVTHSQSQITYDDPHHVWFRFADASNDKSNRVLFHFKLMTRLTSRGHHCQLFVFFTF